MASSTRRPGNTWTQYAYEQLPLGEQQGAMKEGSTPDTAEANRGPGGLWGTLVDVGLQQAPQASLGSVPVAA